MSKERGFFICYIVEYKVEEFVFKVDSTLNDIHFNEYLRKLICEREGESVIYCIIQNKEISLEEVDNYNKTKEAM